MPFDLFTGVDMYVVFLAVIFAAGVGLDQIKISFKKIRPEVYVVVGLLLLAGVLQIFFQDSFAPALSTPYKYFRSMFLMPLIFSFIVFVSFERGRIGGLIKSYLAMIGVFCVLALVQFFTGVFPGDQMDFTGRLTWPYIDFLTLKAASANWVAFLVTPALVIAFVRGFGMRRIRGREFYFNILIFLLACITLFFVQSYGAFGAAFAAITLYLFRELPFKKFLVALIIVLIAGGGLFFLQKNTNKYQIIAGEVEHKFDTSVEIREDIYKMNWHIITERTLLGVGLNQYQSYFRLNQEEVLGHSLKEDHMPPHAHNFFLSFWTNLGIFGALAMVILIFSVFVRSGFSPSNAAVFALTAIMIHGLIDAYYWKQETVYIFWMMIIFAYFKTLKKEDG
ncbi:O-antigen ligase family protein [Pseudomonadota bacterium]